MTMEYDKKYRVLRLVADSFKRLKAVDITPNRTVQVIAGKNRAGKSSVLDAIQAALGGAKGMPDQPLRVGAEEGQIVCILGDDKPELLVKRTFSADGKTTLEITSAEGYKAPTPQAILDKMCSKIAFDPVAFARMDTKKQAELLRQLVGLDFGDIEADRKRLYDERTTANREAKRLDAQAEGIAVPAETPDVEVSVADLMAELKRCQGVNEFNRRERSQVEVKERESRHAEATCMSLYDRVMEAQAALDRLQRQLTEATHQKDIAASVYQGAKATANVLQDEDCNVVQRRMVAAQTVNIAVANKARKRDLRAQATEQEASVETLTTQIGSLDARKSALLQSAPWPVPGLGFSEDGVTYNGLPFSQASSAEQLRVSFAIGTAMSPHLKTALIRDASLLDAEEFKAVCDMAEERDMQILLERVGNEGGPMGVLIEDGTCIQPSDVVVTKPKRKRGQPVEKPVADDQPFDAPASVETQAAEEMW